MNQSIIGTRSNFMLSIPSVEIGVDITAQGPPGHGSRFIENTAMEQIIQIANRAMDFREGQRAALHGSKFNAKHANCNHAVAAKRRRLRKKERGQCLTLGDVTSLNITTMQAGLKSGDRYAYNVVPSTARCVMFFYYHFMNVSCSTFCNSRCVPNYIHIRICWSSLQSFSGYQDITSYGTK